MQHELINYARGIATLVREPSGERRTESRANGVEAAEAPHDLADPLLTLLAKMEIAATRLW